MTKKQISLAFVVLLAAAVALCLTGCGKKGADTTEVTPPAGPSVSQPTADQPAAEAPAQEAGASGVGQKLSALLGSVKMPTSYEMKTVVPTDSGTQTITQIMKASAGKTLKMKQVHEAGWTIMDMEARVIYMHNPQMGKDVVLKMPLQAEKPQGAQPPTDYVQSDVNVTGSESVDGVACWVYTITTANKTSKVWLGKQDGLPRQVETDQQTRKFEYSRINQIPDSEFELPPGMKVQAMPTMPQRPGTN